MQAQTLSKKQQKKTLSAKKQKKETIKNVLSHPYESYWPQLSHEHSKNLQTLLEKHLPQVVAPRSTVPYSKIKGVPKEERKKFRQALQKTSGEPLNRHEIDPLVFGVNTVSKLLESREIASILVSSDVQPRLLVQHVVDQAVLYKIPILIIENLRTITKSRCGIASVILGIKKTLAPSSKLNLIHQKICNIHKSYPVPKNHINYQRSNNNNINKKEDESVIELQSDYEDVEIVEVSPKREFCYLKRKSIEERTFVPNSDDMKRIIMVDRMETDSSGFLAFNSQERSQIEYRHLTVKRVRGDQGRLKRKRDRSEQNKAAKKAKKHKFSKPD